VWFELGEGMVDRAVMPNLEPDFPAFRYVEKQSSDQADEVAERAIVHIENADRWAAGWSSNFLTQLGIWAVFKNNNAQAARYTAMAIKAEPGNAKALNNMAVILRAEGDFENAIKFANLAVKADSSYQRGWKTLANTAQMAGDSETFKKAQHALKSFER
jgi:tetratricopeptide (TPR) repeat protein